MLDRSFFYENYWKYFLKLESQFAYTERFVAISASNEKCYSVEYLELYQAICSEIDTVAKVIACYLDPGFSVNRRTGIRQWGYELTNFLPELIEDEVVLDNKTLIIPWNKFGYDCSRNKKGNVKYKLKDGCQTPGWWNDYNSVKHGRIYIASEIENNYSLANQKNVIYALSALFSLESLFLYKKMGMLSIDGGYWNNRSGLLSRKH